MEQENLLDFLNNTKEFCAPNFAVCDLDLNNFLDLLAEDEQFTQKIDLGVMYIKFKTLNQCIVVDGFNRVLSLSLLLHAICECYKKTSVKNESAVKVIRKKYLLNGVRTKLRLNEECQKIYDKIIFGEKLSGKEKNSPVFVLFHSLWTQIKEDELQASTIFKMLQKIVVNIVDTGNISIRDLYYTLNKNERELDQLLLIQSYLNDMGIIDEWVSFKKIFKNKTLDILLFYKDFFVTKFNFKEYNQSRLYEIFKNYFETMLQYMPKETLIEKFKNTAIIYRNLLNVNIGSEKLNKALIQIKMHNGEDTFAYLLNIYEDYLDGNINEATFYEILLTIDEYLKNRLKTPNNIAFNELVEYLNTFITCK